LLRIAGPEDLTGAGGDDSWDVFERGELRGGGELVGLEPMALDAGLGSPAGIGNILCNVTAAIS
jgi:hypothetical protein